ncbi:MAG: hypothetical protein WA655_03595 [Candidatus Korobacteraceae bacterium]
MAAPASAFVSSLFDQLATYIANGTSVTDIQNDLTNNCGVPSAVASMIAQALVNGGKIDYTGQPTNLGDLLNPFLPSPAPTALTNITVDDLSFACDLTDQSFEFDGSATVPLTLAGQSASWSPALSVSSAVQDGNRDNEGTLSSSFTLGTLNLDAEYDFSSDSQTLTADISAASGQLSLQSLCSGFGLTMPSLWGGVSDISLTDAALELDMSGETDTVQITAQYSAGSLLSGDAFAMVINNDTGWTLVFGAELGTNFSNFPVIGSIGSAVLPTDLTAALATDSAAASVVISTGAIQNLIIPDANNSFANYPAISFAGAGLMFAALLDLSSGGSGTCTGSLANFNNPPPKQGEQPTNYDTSILITADLTPSVVTLTAELGSRTLYDCGKLELTLSIFLAATPTIQIQSSITVCNVAFDMSIDLTAEELFCILKLQSTGGITLPNPLQNVQIDSIQGVIGIDFDKAEAEVGMAAVFAFNNAPTGTSSNSVISSLVPHGTSSASAGQVPAPSEWECALIVGIDADLIPDIDLALLSINQINLGDACGFLCPAVPSGVTQALNGIQLNNILIYWCDTLPGNFAALNLTLPDGTALGTGFIFQGGLSWGSFSAFAGINVTSSGCSGNLSVSPINIPSGGGILSITGDGPGQNGVTAGGPIVQFNTNPSSGQYFTASWTVKLLDVFNGSADVTVTSTELDFTVTANAGLLISGDIQCQLDPAQGWFNFQCSGSLDDNYSVDLDIAGFQETISLGQYDFLASVSVDVNDDGISGSLDATFEFGGINLSVPTVSVDGSWSSAEDLVDSICDQIKNYSSTIFNDFVGEMENLGQKFEKDIEHLEDYFTEFVDWFWGDNKKKNPAYFKNYALVQGSGPAVFEVYDMKLRFVPDWTTLSFLDPKGKNTITQNMDPVLALLPQDTVMVPSRVNGTVFQDQSGNFYLSLSDGYYTPQSGPNNEKKNTPNSAKYSVQNATAFLQRSTCLTEFLAFQVNQYGAGMQSASNDIDNIDDNKLLQSKTSIQSMFQTLANVMVIQGDGGGQECSLFLDGIRYVLAGGWTTVYFMSFCTSGYSATKIPQAAYDGIPEYALPEGIAIAPKQLYRSNVQSQTTVYWASNDGAYTLHPINQAYYDQNFPGQAWTRIPDEFLWSLRMGNWLYGTVGG